MARTNGLVALVIAAVLTGCSPAPEPIAPASDGVASAFQRTFGPAFPPQPPGPPGGSIDGVVLARDRRSVDLSFIGGQAYERSNACSEEYGAWAGVAGDTLELEVMRIEHPEQPPLAPNMACTAEGHGYVFRILLPAPFLGTKVRDRPTGPIWIAPPERVAEPGLLPEGWNLTSVTGEPSLHELGRMWQPRPEVPGARGRFSGLYQAFGGATSNQVHQPIATRTIHGQDVPIGRNGDDGFAAGWTLGPDHVWFTVIDPAVSLDAFVAMANAVAIPAP